MKSKIISVLLCAALVVSVTPVVSAQNTVADTVNPTTNQVVSEPYIVTELTEKRTENTKHFLMSDRSVLAAVYDKAVHYKVDDVWIDIDNSLSINNENEIENHSNRFKTKFSKKSNGNKLVTITKDNYSLSWMLDDTNKVDAKISRTNKTESEDLSALKNIQGTVTYPNIQNNVDLQYVVSGDNVKENIILQNANTPTEFSFTYKFNQLNYRTNANNQIEFYNNDNPDKVVFIIDAPHMYDSAKAYSDNIEMQIIEADNGFILKLMPDREWLLSEDRVYPIVIDPTTLSSQKATSAWDIEIRDTQTSAFWYQAGDFLVGSNTNGDVYRTLLKFRDLPNIGVGGIVVNAEMSLTPYLYSGVDGDPAEKPRPTDDIQVNIHRITANWPEQTATWNLCADNFDPVVEDYFIYNDTDARFYANITRLVNEWYANPNNNYGVMLKANSESAANHVMQFCSSDYVTNNDEWAALRPILLVNYRTCIGLEDYWSYTTQGMGGYGTGYVNNYNGNLTYIHNDVSFNSAINGFIVSHVYNSANASSSTGRYGKGWGLNLVQTLTPITITNNPYVKFVYTDGDGTKHYFMQEDDNLPVVDEDGLGYTYTSLEGTEITHQITDKSGNILKFDQAGALRRIIDTNGNTINLNYSPVPNQFNYLTSITTSSGGNIQFNYDSEYKLTSIKDNANRVTTYSYTNGNLTKISYPDGTDLDFTYYSGANGVSGSSSWLHDITLPNGYQYRYGNYDNGKIYMSTEQAVSGAQIDKLYYTYNNNQTTVEDTDDRHICYQFDSFGRVTCAYDNEENSYSESYTTEAEVEENVFKNNKLTLTSNNIRYINNYIDNPAFADGLTSWTQHKEAPNETQISVVSDETYVSSKSIKISSTASSIQALLQNPSTSAGKTYTLSANLKAEGITSANYGAGVEIVTSSPQGNKYYYSDFITGTTDAEINNGFVTASVTAAMASNENIVRIGVGLYNASGTVWIDSVQLEDGDTANKINLLSNSSFEKNTGSSALPTGYTSNFTAGTAGSSSSAKKNSGSYSLRISGGATVKRFAHQMVNVSGKAGDVYSMGGWAMANAVPNHSANGVTDFKLTAGVYYTDGSYKEYPFDLNEYVSDWQYVAGSFVMEHDYNKMLIYCSYNYNANTAYFDDIFLYRDTAQSYKYDENGNVISTADYAKQQSNFEYTSNNLSTLIEPTGTKYTYKYDDKDNLVNANSNIGIEYNIAYDNYGNATQTAITLGSSQSVESNNVYYIKNKSSGQYLTVDGGVCTRANINQQPLTNAPLQRWRVTKLSNGNYIMRPDGCNEHALTFESRSVANTTVLLGVTGANVQTYDWSQWSLISNNDDEHSFKIKTIATGCVTQYISIAASNTTKGGNIYMDYDGSTDNKSWIFIPANEIITSSATYQNNGNYPHTVTDSRGNTTTYTYDIARGLQTGVTDAKGNLTEYEYNSLNDRLNYVIAGGNMAEYYYNSVGQLTGIDSPSATQYTFNYDEFGNTINTLVGTQVLSTNTYDIDHGLLTFTEYGNGPKIGFTYDTLDRITQKLYNEVVKVRFRYDKFGNLYEKQDLFTNTTYRYNYDLSGRITGIVGSNDTSLNYVYDDYNRVEKFISKVEGNTNSTEYIYGDSSVNGQKDGLIYGVKQNGTQRISYGYDNFARLNTRTLNTTTPFVTQYTYHQGATAGTTTTLVKTVQNGNDVYEYSYDAVGNITQIKKNGAVYESYTYDALGQLTTVTRGNDVYTYTYDNGGNIQSVTKNGQTHKNYTYGDSEWRDLLTQFNGDTITYDEIGNPLQYRDGFEFTWSNGRQLTRVFDSTYYITTTYQYNADGLRSYKNTGGLHVYYYWVDGHLIAQRIGPKYTIFLYDENGTPYGFVYDDTYYYYVQNAQGDIIGILDANGNKIVEYTYSAWGEVLSVTGSHSNTIGQDNPLRYRGYYYDDETGFYYLQSRYYDPITQRFINADGLLAGVGGPVLGYNLFAYCANNPINFVDSTGQFFEEIKVLAEIFKKFIMRLVNVLECYFVINNEISMSEEQKKFVATVVGEMGGEDTLGRKAVAHSIMNRFYEPRDAWHKTKSVSDILVENQYNAVDGKQYTFCKDYLDARDGTNRHYEKIIAEVIPIYYGLEPDFTGGIHYFFIKKDSQALLRDLLDQPNRYTEIHIPGIDGDRFGIFRCEW